MPVHPTALVDETAYVDPDAEIGPYCILGPEVRVGRGTRMLANVFCEGPLWIGEDNIFYPYSVIGVAGQDLKYRGERAETHIGSHNRIREFVTIHRGTEGGGLKTAIGDHNLLMAYVHVAHDVTLGSHCVLANAVTFAGHVTVGDWAVIGASTGVHQFCRIGRQSIVGGYSVITRDVLPFSNTVTEREARVFGANRVGLERRGFANESIEGLQTAFRLLTRAGLNTSQAVARIRDEGPATPEIEELLAFIATSERGVIK